MVAQHQHHAGRDALRRDVRPAAIGQVQAHQARAMALDVATGRRQRPSVHHQPAIGQGHGLAADRGHALDQARAIRRRVEHHHVTGPGTPARHQHLAGEGHAQAVGTHVHQHPVARAQGRLHRTAGHVVMVGEAGARHHQQRDRQQQRRQFPAQPGAQRGRWGGGCGSGGHGAYPVWGARLPRMDRPAARRFPVQRSPRSAACCSRVRATLSRR